MRNTRKKPLLNIALPLLVAAVLVGTTIVQPVAIVAQPTSGSSVVYTYGGTATMHLPPGGGELADRPTDLMIDVWYAYEGKGVFFGPGTVMRIWLWMPSANAYNPVAIIENNPNASFATWLMDVVNGTPVMQNIFMVDASELQVDRPAFNVITANLTVPVNITFGDPFPAALKALNFTLPPLAVEVRGIDGVFVNTISMTTPAGWQVTGTDTNQPAWVRFWIPQWLGANELTTTGEINLNAVTTYVPP